MGSVPRHHRPPRIGDYIQKCRDSVVPPDTFLEGCPIVKQSGNGPLELPVGGRLKYFWRQWYAMGASRRVVRWLKNGYPLRFRRSVIQGNALPPLSLSSPSHLVTHYRDETRQQALQSKIQDLLDKDCIREMGPNETGFFSRVFLVPKKSGGFRLVIDLSELNEHLSEVSFTMDTLKLIKSTATQGMWATSLDFSDAYHHIPINPAFRIYLCFQVGNRRFMYLVLPFGLSTAPWVFTEVAKQVKIWSAGRLRSLFQYLDDWLSLFRRRSMAVLQTQQLVRLCCHLGLLVNHAKSELVPKQSIVFLGERLDFRSLTAYATSERQSQVIALIDQAVTDKGLPFHKAESLLGLLTATYPTISLGRLHLRWLQWAVILVIRQGRKPNQWIPVTGQLARSLMWWTVPDRWSPGVLFQQPAPQVTVYTDASMDGWGIICEDATWDGTWKRKCHINWLELRVILIALQVMRTRLQNKIVCFYIDNTTAVAYLKKQGGTHSAALMRLAFRIWKLAEQLKVTIVPRHIAGQRNVLADLASRQGQVLPTEWTLTDKAFRWLCKSSPWGPPTLELFGNRCNHLLPRFVSPCQDSQATLIDAIETPWPAEVLYAYPPPFLLSQLLLRLQREPTFRLLLVCSWSPQAKWVPLLGTLNVMWTTPFPLSFPLLRQPHWDHVQSNPSLANLRLICIIPNGSNNRDSLSG